MRSYSDSRVDPDGGEVVAHLVAQDALDEVEVVVDERGSFGGIGALLDFGPEVDQEANVGAEIVIAGAFGSGADDESAGSVALLADQHALEALALFVGGDFTGDADVVDGGHENQEAARQRDVAGDTRTFAGDGLLGDLDQNFLSLLQELADDGQVRGLHAGTTATLTASGRAASSAAIATAGEAAIFATRWRSRAGCRSPRFTG